MILVLKETSGLRKEKQVSELRSGYTPGTGLGKRDNGIIKPIDLESRERGLLLTRIHGIDRR
ncbi:MAG: hypothetical protein EOQ81_30690 [Mesorhizobium sp.]|nr:MAG: hypothetical protein EOQ81_30690 [Mesorhizobium sp.]